MERIADDILKGASQIADETGFSVRQVYGLGEKGGLPLFKVGGIICARRSELNRALSAKSD